MGTLPPPSVTDPDVQISRIRFFMVEIRSRRRMGGRILGEGKGWRFSISLKRVQLNTC